VSATERKATIEFMLQMLLNPKPPDVLLTEALAAARLEGVRAGIGAAAKSCGQYREDLALAIRALDAEQIAREAK